MDPIHSLYNYYVSGIALFREDHINFLDVLDPSPWISLSIFVLFFTNVFIVVIYMFYTQF